MNEKALAYICGVAPHQSISGKAWFRQAPGGCEVDINLDSLNLSGPPAFSLCGGSLLEPDGSSICHGVGELAHFCPGGETAAMRFFIERLTPSETVGLTLVMHDNPSVDRDRIIAHGLIREFID